MRREDAFNESLGQALRKTNPKWSNAIIVEETRQITESKGLRVDVLVAAENTPVVAIETSYMKGDADKDATSRLGKHYEKTMEEIRTAIAIELDEKYRKKKSLKPTDMLKYALHQKTSRTGQRRFPMEGFMEGSYQDIARLASSTSIPKEEIESVAAEVGSLIKAVSAKLHDFLKDDKLESISKELYQRSILSALNTTSILWLNAFLVQRMLQGGVYDIPVPTHVPSKCVESWKKIHGINWVSIFKPAIRILEDISKIETVKVSESLKLLLDAVEKIEMAKLGRNINIGAELFPILSSDRKESAAFYTQPATAELLAALTITQDTRQDWSDPGLFKDFKIADLTCGTGTLLRFGYRQVRIYHEQTGAKQLSVEKLHQNAMESGLHGVDVSPIAAHLTSSSLAVGSKQPYSRTNIGWVGVGNPDMTGSIEYMKTNAIPELGVSSENIGISHGQGNSEIYNSVPIIDGSIDVCLLNPPYSRTRRGQSAFDICGLSDTERKKCQEKWGRLVRDEPCLKTAGMAATFLCIAKKKVKPGGKIGFVLPRSMAFMDTWEATRKMVEDEFEDITAVVVQSGRALGRQGMSADTKMEEMLLVATKRLPSQAREKRHTIRCVTLKDPVTRVGEAAEIAKSILHGKLNGPIMLGAEIGSSAEFIPNAGIPWSSLGIVGDGLNIIMNGLLEGNFKNTDGVTIKKVSTTTIGELFKVGPTHDLLGHANDDNNTNETHERGAFTFYPLGGDNTMGPNRSLWSANKDAQTKMIVMPTHKGVVFDKTTHEKMSETRTNLFISRGMRWTSQKITAAFTTKPVMGGAAWTGLYNQDVNVMKAFALWANSIYGMTTRLARGDRTQHGRSRLQVKAIGKVPCPDFGKLGEKTLAKAARDFDRLSKMTLKIANLAESDPVRDKINQAVSEMLGIPGYDTETLTKLWCEEPAVGKIR